MSMKTKNEELISILESAIEESLRIFESQNNENSLSDLYIRFDGDNTLLSIYDDVENKMLDVNLEKVQEDDIEAFEKQLNHVLKTALSGLKQKGLFDKDYIFKPFAVSRIDDDFIVSEELIFIDDNTLKLDGDLLANLDKELDDFLKNLMK